MSLSRIMKFITGGSEAFLGIPFVGAAFVFSTSWGILFVMFIAHFITLLIARNAKGSMAGSILGMVTSFIAVIPFVGITMHIITAIVLLIDAITHEE
ncbi:hypothetical protein [Lentibacillus cibarius]|uniref:DUF4064 domain-containing protein n=1 Tax=Lentibacillus cibarius TaxID=2583219 RepID=A0A5S3QJR0_9BACI|nr:hypothetical protein [Lentibacillus cibarius]TMN21967.1 hypothetical protein FFL34_07425 [Lentibacillus cibarius]